MSGLTRPALRHPPFALRPLRWIGSAVRTARQRARLAALEPHLRRDIGLSDREIAEESGRPFWDVPEWWR